MIIASHIRDSHGDITAELVFQTLGREHLHIAKLNLLASRPRTELAKQLRRRASKIAWEDAIEQVCAITLREWRALPPLTKLEPTPMGTRSFLVPPLLPVGEPVIVYGDGEAGKSLLMLALGLTVTTGGTILPDLGTATPGGVLYLDWETSRDTHQERLDGLMRGSKITDQGDLYYQAMSRPIADAMPHLRAEISRLGIVFVIVDSFAYACGPEPETADAAMRMFSAIRELGNVTTAVVAHVPHSLRNGSATAEEGRPFGSVFVRNSARVAWELRHGMPVTPRTIAIGLYQTKNNLSHRQDPLGFSIRFDDHSIQFLPASLEEDPDLASHLPVAQRILTALQSGPMTYEDLKNTTGASLAALRQSCRRLERKQAIEKIEYRDGKRTVIRWEVHREPEVVNA